MLPGRIVAPRIEMGTAPSHSRTSFLIPPDHPSIPGHFPGDPVVPGVVILDAVRLAAGQYIAPGLGIAALPQVKFVSALRPGLEAHIDLELRDTLLQFVVSSDEQVIAKGAFALGAVTRP
jgi:3-hydroxymyristoyl/3-hydroxydecanoyl-(acyl carrier protein) dehydratase